MLPPKHVERAERLSPAKRALLERWKAERADQAAADRKIPLREASCPAPLASSQQRLWFLDQLSPGSPQYNIATALLLSGPLDAEVLQQSLQSIIARHEAMRTAFRVEQQNPVQIVVPGCDFTLPTVDLTGVPAAQQLEQCRELAESEALTAFDLTKPPLLRGKLLRTAPQEHTLLLTMHHIVSDGWSMAVLADEVAQYYLALTTGEKPSLAPLPIQFADYATWQRGQLSAKREQELLSYWRTQLEGAPPHLRLPQDFPRPATQTYAGSVQRCTVSTELTAALREYSQSQNATLYMTLLAAFQVVLARYSGQHDVCVGSPIANRSREETERLIGFFANTLVMRSNVSENPAFKDFLTQVRRTTLDAYAHKDLPLDRILEELQPERNLSSTPLFQVMFVMQNIPLAARQLDDLTLKEVSFDHAPVSSFDATLNIDELEDALRLSFVYNTSLFQPETAARMVASYEEVLRQIVSNPAQRVLELPIVPMDERKMLLNTWSKTTQAPLPEQCINELITLQAKRTPEQTAVVDGAGSLTYGELEARSNCWARSLQAAGVQREDVVAICIDRSCEMIVALLGVMKSGGAYLPLDPEQPSGRLLAMLEDSGAALLLTTSSHADCFVESKVELLSVDEKAEELRSYSPEPLDNAADPSDLAYIIYTSGSTGTPKGVEIEHRGLVNHALSLAAAYELTPGDGMLQFLSIGFDAAGEEIFPALISGAALHIHPTPRELIGADLLNWSRQQKVNVLHIPPPVWDSVRLAIVDSGADSASHLKTVLTGGEGVSRTKLASFQQFTLGKVKLLYAYGVSEATITSTLLTANDHIAPRSTDRVPIGRAIPNQQLYVLDAFQNLVPPGVPGELYIGGTGVGRGYRGRPELTAERFITLEFELGPERLYRTGDLVRFLHDGNLEFLGRIDHQIKVRGCRIEPAEIETAIGEHPAVSDVAIVARDNPSTGKRLIAYITANSEWTLEPRSMREFLSSKLPAPMIPADFVALEKLPRGSTGKVDISALPDPPARDGEASRNYRAPETSEEQTLVDIWQAVLGLQRLGVDDNFFALGGDSIQTIQVVSKAADAGLRVTPRQMFEHQTIAELAVVVELITKSRIDQGPVTGEVPLTPIQHAFFDQGLRNPNHFNQAVMLAIDPIVTEQMVSQAAQQLIAHHDILRARYEQDISGQWKQQIVPLHEVEIETVDLSLIPTEKQPAAIEEATEKWQASLSITDGPLVRFVYFYGGMENAPQLLVVSHHLVIDGVSWRILIGDLELLFRQFANHTEAALPPKTSSVQIWADHLQQFATAPEAANELVYWNTQADDASSDKETSEDALENTYESAETIRNELSREETQHFLQNATRPYRSSPAELLLTVVAKTVADIESKSQVAINMEGHGREELFDDVDLSRTIGWFTSLFPLHIQAPASEGFEPWIMAVKEQSRAVPHRGVGYGILRWLTNSGRKLAAAQQTTIAFNYLGSFDQLLPDNALVNGMKEAPGPLNDPRNMRPHRWEINAYIRNERLCIDWTYSSALDAHQTMKTYGDRLFKELQQIIEHCMQETEGRATPSDFPLAGVDQEELDRVAALLAAEDA